MILDLIDDARYIEIKDALQLRFKIEIEEQILVRNYMMAQLSDQIKEFPGTEDARLLMQAKRGIVVELLKLQLILKECKPPA